MDFNSIVALLQGLPMVGPYVAPVLLILGSLVVLGQTYILASPSIDDDAWYAKLEATPILGSMLKALAAFAPIQRK